MKFRTVKTTKTENLAGGESYSESPKLALISLVLTSFVKDKFYETADAQLTRLKALLTQVPADFSAKLAIYARNEFGMRSITHAIAGELVKGTKGQSWMKNAIEKIVKRPDDMLEILGYYTSNYGKPIPNALKKGLGLALAKFDEYALAKYRGDRSSVKLVDLVNLIHYKPSEEMQGTFKKLMAGELTSTETWETKLTQAGQKAESEEEKTELKNEAWGSLLKEGKLGYFALLRNLRNILKQSPENVALACEQLVNEKAIKRSLVLPFRFMTALDELKHESNSREVIQAISRALEISVSNVPKFDGKTLVVLDESGSMMGQPFDIGSLFAAALYKSNNADLMLFADNARYINLNPDDTVSGMIGGIMNARRSGGTDFNCIFPAINGEYDRIIILSDMQGWVGYHAPTRQYNHYCKTIGKRPFVYSFDLNGHGTLQFPEENVFAVAGFSEKIFDVMKLMEQDKQALVKKIEAIVL